MEFGSEIPTCSALRESLGIERYTNAPGIVSGLVVKFGLHLPMHILTDMAKNKDVLDVYGSIITHGVNS